MQNMVVLHFIGGNILKGTTEDFYPNKDMFHFREKGIDEIHEIRLSDLKAVYFVKSFEGRKDYREKGDLERVGLGKRIKIRFKDGETQVGYTQGFSPNRTGFFVFPSDPDCNNDRIFVVTAATVMIDFV